MKSQFSIIALLAVLSVTIGFLFHQSQNSEQKPPELAKTILLPKPKTIQGINFTDHLGQPFTKQQLLGKWSIVFFGFTNCPDICPNTMHLLKQVKQTVADADKWGNYQVIMVTVDPKRDSTELLSKYVPYFDPEFIGIRSDEAITTEFARQLGVLFVAHDDDDQQNYEVDHSASIILINPKAEMAGVITAPHKADEINADLISMATYFDQDHQLITTTEPSNAPALIEQPALETSEAELESELTIANAWIRPAPPGAMAMAAYFAITNHSDNDIVITDSNSAAFGMTMIHDTVIENDMASMEHLDSLTIAAKQTVLLQPLGKHMMLMQPQSELNIGDTVNIDLISDAGKTFSYQVTVKPQP